MCFTIGLIYALNFLGVLLSALYSINCLPSAQLCNGAGSLRTTENNNLAT